MKAPVHHEVMQESNNQGSHVFVQGHSPIVDCSSGVLAALDFDHEQREEQEEGSHGKADTVYGPVAHQHLAVDVAPQGRQR